VAVVGRVGLGGGQHHRREQAHAVHHAHQVDAQHPFPVAECVFPDQAAGAHAGVVEHEVRRAEALLHGGGERLHLIGLGHVDDAGQHLDLAELGHGAVQGIGLHVDQHEVHAALGGEAGGFQAEAGAGAGDDGGGSGHGVSSGRRQAGARLFISMWGMPSSM